MKIRSRNALLLLKKPNYSVCTEHVFKMLVDLPHCFFSTIDYFLPLVLLRWSLVWGAHVPMWVMSHCSQYKFKVISNVSFIARVYILPNVCVISHMVFIRYSSMNIVDIFSKRGSPASTSIDVRVQLIGHIHR